MYMLLLTSLRKTGRSSGKIKITFWIATKRVFMVMKKREPLMFYQPAEVLRFDCQNKILMKIPVHTVVSNFM